MEIKEKLTRAKNNAKYELGYRWNSVKVWAWNIFAPDSLKYFQSRYQEVKKALDIRDEEYEADLNELTDENSRLFEELEKVKAKLDAACAQYDDLCNRISSMIEGLGE